MDVRAVAADSAFPAKARRTASHASLQFSKDIEPRSNQ